MRPRDVIVLATAAAGSPESVRRQLGATLEPTRTGEWAVAVANHDIDGRFQDATDTAGRPHGDACHPAP